ncbi:hypothetical protein Cob_v010014 [Colletotrichum orbiculare MAFF 240422]|uniref:Uncharacterized protein n=1 Tax=Colletotrichum orbiculare (strain 104-T / ATCC 96160 / CBS 514.97 / LARS 414 / MAFF 240422) TaxID=1213857 RepID=A0A484FFW0_COLOR|nr:hypothetical protein Cob_v010014 [Colletotrichum orbiculare MAFF 240422]
MKGRQERPTSSGPGTSTSTSTIASTIASEPASEQAVDGREWTLWAGQRGVGFQMIRSTSQPKKGLGSAFASYRSRHASQIFLRQ